MLRKTPRLPLRPQPIKSFNEAAAKCCGRLHFGYFSRTLHAASMRPQQNAAEDDLLPDAREIRARASMRPQQNAAEDDVPIPSGDDKIPSFNEAAAKCCGRHFSFRLLRSFPYQASMRPQQNAAEDVQGGLDSARVPSASMRPQQNAAEDVDDLADLLGLELASMRPQQNAAEDGTQLHIWSSSLSLQ